MRGAVITVAAGKLQPTRLVETVSSVTDAGKLLDDMTSYNTLGFTVIDNWNAATVGLAA